MMLLLMLLLVVVRSPSLTRMALALVFTLPRPPWSRARALVPFASHSILIIGGGVVIVIVVIVIVMSMMYFFLDYYFTSYDDIEETALFICGDDLLTT